MGKQEKKSIKKIKKRSLENDLTKEKIDSSIDFDIVRFRCQMTRLDYGRGLKLC